MPSTLHERLSELAKFANLSPTQLGVRAGLSTDTVNKWIRLSKKNQKPGRMEQVTQLANKYGVSAEWLQGKSDRGGPGETIDIQLEKGDDEAVVDGVVAALVPRGYRATRAIAAISAARVYEKELERDARNVERLAALAAGLMDADEAIVATPSSAPSGPTGPSTRHRIRRAK